MRSGVEYMETNVDRIIAPADEPDLVARAQPFPDYAHLIRHR